MQDFKPVAQRRKIGKELNSFKTIFSIGVRRLRRLWMIIVYEPFFLCGWKSPRQLFPATKEARKAEAIGLAAIFLPGRLFMLWLIAASWPCFLCVG